MADSDPQKPAKKLLVAVVDDDESVRESLPDLLTEFGFSALVFSSAEEFLKSGAVALAKALLLDVAMPGMTGPELQAELKKRGLALPIVFITGRKDDATRDRLIENGAIDVLQKPFSDVALRQALNRAMN
jgi:FixJ family two-component response regulator